MSPIQIQEMYLFRIARYVSFLSTAFDFRRLAPDESTGEEDRVLIFMTRDALVANCFFPSTSPAQ